MYEDKTFENILDDMLDRIPDTFDKREGSIIYDALAPVAIELQLIYLELDNILKETFADTASRTYLIKRCAERGIIPKQATQSILLIKTFPRLLEIPINTRVGNDKLVFKIIEKKKNGLYLIECENKGKIGNIYGGKLNSLDYIENLEYIEIVKLVIPADDEEETETLRKRYFKSFEAEKFGGNKADYIDKVKSLNGVGACKIIPTWQGGGTVLVLILDTEFKKATIELIDNVQKKLDPEKNGKGDGIAPIGHVVTVDTVEEIDINIDINIIYKYGFDFENIQDEVIELIQQYIKILKKEWEEKNELVVRISQIESRILQINGVVDVNKTKINNLEDNLKLNSNQLPKLRRINERIL